MTINSAAIQTSGIGGSSFDFMSLLPLILIFVVFYFLLIRPQQKKVKKHQEMLDSLRRGDRVVTNGGLIGTIVKIASDREVQVEIAEDVKVRVVRAMISDVLAKTEPANLPSSEEDKKSQMKTSNSKKVTSIRRKNVTTRNRGKTRA